MRKETEGSGRFGTFSKRQRPLTSRLSSLAGRYTVDIIRNMREQARRYFLPGIRKGRHTRKPPDELRLTLEIPDRSPTRKDEEKPKYEGVSTPVELRKWSPSLRNLQGIFLPAQGECNHFSFELAKGVRETSDDPFQHIRNPQTSADGAPGIQHASPRLAEEPSENS